MVLLYLGFCIKIMFILLSFYNTVAFSTVSYLETKLMKSPNYTDSALHLTLIDLKRKIFFSRKIFHCLVIRESFFLL